MCLIHPSATRRVTINLQIGAVGLACLLNPRAVCLLCNIVWLLDNALRHIIYLIALKTLANPFLELRKFSSYLRAGSEHSLTICFRQHDVFEADHSNFGLLRVSIDTGV